MLEKDNGTIFRYSNHENTVLRQIHKQIINDSEIELFNQNNLNKKEILSWIDSITNWKSKNSEGKKIKYVDYINGIQFKTFIKEKLSSEVIEEDINNLIKLIPDLSVS